MLVLRILQVIFAAVTGLGLVALIMGFQEPTDPGLSVFGMVVMGIGGCFVMFTAVIIGRKKRLSHI